MKLGIIGYGTVGKAIYECFIEKKFNIKYYDKYKSSHSYDEILESDIIFLCLATPFTNKLDSSIIEDVCQDLKNNNYSGIVVLKSTVEPGTTKSIYNRFKLNIVHNPEFLSANTALEDFKSQKQIVIGYVSPKQNYTGLLELYRRVFNNAFFTTILSCESELMKLGVNCFYATKIQYFNEIYLLCQKLNISYEKVLNSMLKNNWINPMHTIVPAPDGKLSFGGKCFPKDIRGLNQFLKSKEITNKVIQGVIDEQSIFRATNNS